MRRRAYEAEVAVWEEWAVPLAAALNSVKGATNVLADHRKWESALDAALFANAIDRATLDAMLAAVRESLPDFQRYFGAKAQTLGLEKLAWYDIYAPFPGEGRVWSYGDGRDFIVEQFGTYSERMRDYAERAFRENWIDAEPREGKRDGAFCMPVRGDESRIMANFSRTTSASRRSPHELGHGYHNINLAERTRIQRQTPMTLAETASIFCETICREGALREAEGSPTEQLEILEGSLQEAAGVVVDILSRFLFESRLFEARREREQSVAELCDLMEAAQRETYGDGVDPLHRYMWAMKPHYYFSAFYNYPYTFGLLFGLGLYARYEADPDEFRSGYDELLRLDGHGRRGRARVTLRDRHPLAGVLAREPRRHPRGDRPLLRVCLDRLRRRLSALALVAVDDRLDRDRGIVRDEEEVEVLGRDHLLGERMPADPRQHPLPVALAHQDRGKVEDLAGLDQDERLEQLVERAEAAGEEDEALRGLDQHRLACVEVLEEVADVEVLVLELGAGELDREADREAAGLARAAVGRFHDPGAAAGDDREALLGEQPPRLPGKPVHRVALADRAPSRRRSRPGGRSGRRP